VTKARVTVRVGNPASPDARKLIEKLDAYLDSLYPAESNYLLSIQALQQPDVTFLAAYMGGKAIGCGAFVDRAQYAEIKRMFVLAEYRGSGIGGRLLKRLETRARASGLKVARLETGVYQKEALHLYERGGYKRCKPFGDYNPNDPLCVFMEKVLVK
jgi:putative acetyltransferase